MIIKYRVDISYFKNDIIKQIYGFKNNQYDNEMIHWFNNGDIYYKEWWENGQIRDTYVVNSRLN